MNWKNLIQDLRAAGMTQAEIALGAGCSQSFVSELLTEKKGKGISYKIGTALVALHKKVALEAEQAEFQ